VLKTCILDSAMLDTTSEFRSLEFVHNG